MAQWGKYYGYPPPVMSGIKPNRLPTSWIWLPRPPLVPLLRAPIHDDILKPPPSDVDPAWQLSVFGTVRVYSRGECAETMYEGWPELQVMPPGIVWLMTSYLVSLSIDVISV